MLSRQSVYMLIDGERNYQDAKWPLHLHSYEEWLVYIEDYVHEAKHLLARNDSDDVQEKVGAGMRKIAAMAVCAMEQRGAPAR